MLTLLGTMHRLLCLNVEAVEMIAQATDILIEEQSSAAPEVNADALKQLREMGFPDNRAKKALILNKMNPTEAMEWLLTHSNDDDIDKPLASVPEATATEKASKETEGAAGHTIVDDNLAIYRRFRHRAFKPNQRAFLRLKEMGFEEKDIVDALKVNGNNEKDACDWLLGDRTPTADEMQQGIDPKSSLFQAIINDPVVLLGLGNPRTLLAFEHMLENPISSSEYLTDSVIGPVLLQISKIYQTERHSLPS